MRATVQAFCGVPAQRLFIQCLRGLTGGPQMLAQIGGPSASATLPKSFQAHRSAWRADAASLCVPSGWTFAAQQLYCGSTVRGLKGTSLAREEGRGKRGGPGGPDDQVRAASACRGTAMLPQLTPTCTQMPASRLKGGPKNPHEKFFRVSQALPMAPSANLFACTQAACIPTCRWQLLES
jgi:hypothetical protein